MLTFVNFPLGSRSTKSPKDLVGDEEGLGLRDCKGIVVDRVEVPGLVQSLQGTVRLVLRSRPGPHRDEVGTVPVQRGTYENRVASRHRSVSSSSSSGSRLTTSKRVSNRGTEGWGLYGRPGIRKVPGPVTPRG